MSGSVSKSPAWIVCRNMHQFPIVDDASLVLWTREGRVKPTDYIVSTRLDTCVQAKDMTGLAAIFRTKALQGLGSFARRLAVAGIMFMVILLALAAGGCSSRTTAVKRIGEARSVQYKRGGVPFVMAASAIALRERIPQDVRYHTFADRRAVAGISNFWNVVSNVPFLLIGIVGLRMLRNSGPPDERHSVYWAWATLFLGVALVGVGSAYYHLAPDNPRLTWDRLPMTIAFMSLLAVVIGEWIDAPLGRRCLPALLLIGVLSVIYWRVTEEQGQGDLRPYLVVQFLPLLIIPLITLVFPQAAVKRGYIWGTLAAYVAAKIVESCDERLFRALEYVSGHTLKHFAGAAAACFLVAAMRDRLALPAADV